MYNQRQAMNMHKTTLLRMLLLLASTAALPSESRTDEQPPRRWTLSTTQSHAVYTAHDGRLWSISKKPGFFSIADAKRIVEEQFNLPNPQISGLQFALLEDPRRVWFYADRRQLLLGYDGKSWIERGAFQNSDFVGDCPTRGQIQFGNSNRFAEGICWFLDEFGIHRFDGTQWSYQELGKPKLDSGRPCLAISPNGKRIAAATVPDRLWSYRNGKWDVDELPEQDFLQSRFVVTDAGEFWYLSREQLRMLSLDAPASPSLAKLKALLDDLDDESFDRRETASAELTRLAPQYRRELDAALKITTDFEAKSRLSKIIKNLPPASETASTKAERKRFAGHEIVDPLAVFQDGKGRIFVLAKQILGMKSGFGIAMLIATPDGKGTVVASQDICASFYSQGDVHQAPIADESGDRFWISSFNSMSGARLFDAKTLQIVGQLPDSAYTMVRAIDQTGRVYASRNGSDLMMVFTPEISDSRPSLRIISPDWEAEFARVADDGAIWAFRSDGQLSRFDGREWHTLKSTARRYRSFIAGDDGVVIFCSSENECLLFQNERLVMQTDSIQSLIERNSNLLASAFLRPRIPYGRTIGSTYLAADHDRNLWLCDKGRAFVLKDTQWIDATPALSKAGFRNSCRLLTATGDGSGIYLSDLVAGHDGGKSLLGKVANGDIEFSRTAFYPFDNPWEPAAVQGFRESDGALLISGYMNGSSKRDQNVWRPCTVKIFGDEITSRIPTAGKLLLADSSDNLWIHRSISKPPAQLSVVRNDKIRQSIDMPDTDTIQAVYSDRPGSIYVWTAAGLQHLTAADPIRDPFQFGRLYGISGVPGGKPYTEYSSLGFIVVCKQADMANPRKSIHLIQLPKP